MKEKAKIIIFLLLVSAFTSSYSQSIDTAFSYFDKGRFDRASAEFEKIIPQVEKYFGSDDSSFYPLVLLCTGTSFERIYNYSKASHYYLKACEIYEKHNDQFNNTYLSALHSLAETYRIAGRFRESEDAYLKLADLVRKKYGENHPRYSMVLNNTGTVYHKSGNPKLAEEYYMKSLELTGRHSGSDSDKISVMNNLGALYDDLGDYAKAEKIYSKVLAIRKKDTENDQAGYATSANNLAGLYLKMSKYHAAEPLYLESLSIVRNRFGENHFLYAAGLNNLGALYHSMGRYDKAEALYLEAMEIRGKTLGEDHPAYANSLNNLALLYHELGNSGNAGELFDRSVSITSSALGNDHPDLAAALNNAGIFFMEAGEPEKACNLFLRAAAIRRKILGDKHPDLAVTLNNLALCHAGSGRYEEAEGIYREALAITENARGKMSSEYASCLNNIGSLLSEKGEPRAARKMILQSLDIKREVLGTSHPDYASALNNLALSFQENGSYGKAFSAFDMSLRTYLEQIRQQLGFLSQNEREKYISHLQFFFMTYRNFLLNLRPGHPESGGAAYDIELASKGLLLSADRQIRMQILGSGDTSAIARFNRWISLKASLARQLLLPPGERAADLNAMEKEADDIEKQLIRKLALSGGLNPNTDVKWTEIRERLKPDEAAIEFTSCPVYEGGTWKEKSVYAAVILRQKDKYPTIVRLCEGSDLDTVLKRRHRSEVSHINSIYSWHDTDDPSKPGRGQQLYNLLWKPLESYLADIKTVYYSPSGILHQVSFSAIPCSGSEILSDRFDLNRLSGTFQLASDYEYESVKNLLLYGGIDYDSPPERRNVEGSREITQPLPEAKDSARESSGRGNEWIYLDGTLTETNKIRTIAGSADIDCTVKSGTGASEETLGDYQGVSSPDVIHIATHGFFKPDPLVDYSSMGIFLSSDMKSRGSGSAPNPLLRSGLVFAGANLARKGETISPGNNDGILTAYEASSLYLPGTGLVVLSACETGLGEIRGSEGVFGLQRSFRIAGAKSVLMTLWQIPDYQTSELMSIFYKTLLSGSSPDESLRLAQSEMKRKYPGQPFLWAAFTLIR